MLRSLRPFVLALVAGSALALSSPAAAEDRNGLQEIAITTAYGFSDEHRIEVIPLYARFAWLFPDVIDDPLHSVNLNLKWFLEPWVAGVTSPKQNAIEFGITPIGLKLEYDAGQQVVPYLIAGTGVMYTGLGGYVTSVTPQDLQNAPPLSDDSWTDRDWESRIHQHYRARPYWDDRPTL